MLSPPTTADLRRVMFTRLKTWLLSISAKGSDRGLTQTTQRKNSTSNDDKILINYTSSTRRTLGSENKLARSINWVCSHQQSINAAAWEGHARKYHEILRKEEKVGDGI